MSLRVVRLGTARLPGEGLRIGTVRYPPRGVPKSEHAKQNWYDLWLPELAPSVGTMKLARQAETPREWARFVKRYRAEMAKGEADRMLTLLAELSHQAHFSVGCYCVDEARCHRSVLRALLREHGARLTAED